MAPRLGLFGKGNQGGGGKEAGLSGGGPPVIEPTIDSSPLKSETPAIDPVQVELNKTASAFSELMDDMEARVPKNGPFFLQLGQKESGFENRAMILREGEEANGKFEYLVITPTSRGKLVLQTRLVDSKIVSIQNQFRNVINGEMYFSTGDKFTVSPIDEAADGDFVKNAMKKSLEESRKFSAAAKTEAAVQAQRREQNGARALSALLDTFDRNNPIQSSVGEGTTTPPTTG